MLETQETTNCVLITAHKAGKKGAWRQDRGWRNAFQEKSGKNGTDGISGVSRWRIFLALSEFRDIVINRCAEKQADSYVLTYTDSQLQPFPCPGSHLAPQTPSEDCGQLTHVGDVHVPTGVHAL